MDFIRVGCKETQDKATGLTRREFYPALLALDSQDLVIRGGQFVAIWDEDTKLYSRRQSHVPDIIDRAFFNMVAPDIRAGDIVKKMRNFDNQMFSKLQSLIRQIGDMGPELDQRLVFADQEPTKEDAATFKMPYALSDAPCPAWDEICEMLYDPDERAKIEWAIGSILTGEAKDIQKFYVFFGPPGSGKSTILNVIQMLFFVHAVAFNAAEMGKSDSQFSLEPFKNNPMVAIDQDADLSRIETNTNLNKITAHDKLHINAKGKSLYEIIPRCTCFIGSNEPVKISNRKSGLFRRLVDIQPTGRLIPEDRYHELMAQIRFELGAIAYRCIQVYLEHGPTYLSSYRSTDMMYRTNDIFNFVEDNRLILVNGVSLKQAHKMYSEWCEETDTRNVYKQYQFRDALKDYFKEFHAEIMIDGTRHRSWFMDLRELEKFSWHGLAPKPTREWLEMEDSKSPLDDLLADMPAQYSQDHPVYPLKQSWEKATTKLRDLDTTQEHFVKVPTQHIVIDFDLKDENGQKSLPLCLEAAALWPATYAEPSRSGQGLHLHYEYVGDVSQLGALVSDGIEVKALLGNSSLRRRSGLHNRLAPAQISSGLPLKEDKPVLPPNQIQTEKGLRAAILKGLRKEVHAYTKPSMDFIAMLLKEADEQGLVYDVSDMWDDILAFAMSSSNQAGACMDIAMKLKLTSDEDPEPAEDDESKPIAYFDLEIYPNLFAVAYQEDRDDAVVVKMINPSAAQIEELITNYRLIGWYNRLYDNHILYAASLGWTVEALYDLSQRIINERDRNAYFAAAYNLSYADGYEFASTPNKNSLKWWEIKLGLPHMEMDLPWDQPVPEDRVLDVMDYLENDVKSTKATIKHIEADFRARQMLAELSGLEVCNTNRQHTEKLIFGDLNRDPDPNLVYTDLREMFPGYEFDQFAPGKEKSTYKGIKVGEGGWVKAKPGMYKRVALFDIASMHPASLVAMNMFGPHTKKFQELLDVRLAIKQGDYERAGELFDGKLKPYLGDKETAKALSDALKVVINSVYGFTAATFPNRFKDPRNIDNIVAKRGALFMVDLVEYLEGLGLEVVHVKTDSVKVVIPDDREEWEVFDVVARFGEKYNYNFEHEDTYEKFCLVNDAVYIAFSQKHQRWEATGAQFLHPVVFKTLFSGETPEPIDYVEIKQVTKGSMHLVAEVSEARQFVGRFGAFVPVLGGRQLLRIDGDKVGAVTGTKGYLWELDEYALNEANGFEIDMSYFQELVDKGKATIEKFGSYNEFVGG